MSQPVASPKPSWERFGDAMLDWGGFVLLALATVLAVSAGDPGAVPDPTWRPVTLLIAAVAAAWLYLGYTRRPLPPEDHRLRNDVFFAGLLVLASVLMLRHPLFFIFMIAGFFYATTLRPLPLAVFGVQTLAISAGAVLGEKVTEQSEDRRRALARLETALAENAGLHRQLLAQAREAGVLDERQRMAREIHDTIAQGLTGIITQLEAAEQAR